MERAGAWRGSADFPAAVRWRPLRAQYKSSEAQFDAAIDGYNDTVLRAVQQTADQLTRIDALARERVEQQQTLAANEAAYKLAEERYRAGLASYLSVLNAETQVLTARQTMVDIVANQAVARVTLLSAIGGSFDPRDVPSQRRRRRAHAQPLATPNSDIIDTGNAMNTQDSNQTSATAARRPCPLRLPCRRRPPRRPHRAQPLPALQLPAARGA